MMNILFAGLTVPGVALAEVSQERLATLSKGINLTTVFDNNKSLSQLYDDLSLIHRVGFKHVRIFVNEAKLRDRLTGSLYLDRLSAIVHKANQDRLGVILCMMSRENEFKDGVNLKIVEHQWIDAWMTIARHFIKSNPNYLFYEIANEPHMQNEQRWAQIQERIRLAVRSVATANTLILTGSPLTMVWSLPKSVPNDNDVAFAFHLYQPMIFTHQGADWGASAIYKDFKGLEYPPNSLNIAMIERAKPSTKKDLTEYAKNGTERISGEIDEALKWRHANKFPLVVTEFGVFRAAPEKSRAVWLSEAASDLEKANIGWTIWEYEGGFGIKDELRMGCSTLVKSLRLCQ